MAHSEGLFGPLALTSAGPPLRGILRACGAGRTGSFKSEVRITSIPPQAWIALQVILEKMARPEGFEPPTP
ncbi:MAG: hypothetical protein AB2535_04480 [Candidatus Thiodiazotropha endolucinida]